MHRAVAKSFMIHCLYHAQHPVRTLRLPLRGFASKVTVGQGQYRNAVASGRRCASLIEEYRIHPTLPRYGTDIIQAPILTFEAKPISDSDNHRVTENTEVAQRRMRS